MRLSELNDLVAEFIREKALKPNSQRAYTADLRSFLEFYAVEKMELKDFTRKKISGWLSQYPPRAANRRGTNIRKFLLWLNEIKQVDIHAEIRLPWKFSDPIPQKPDRAVELTDEEFNRLISSNQLELNKRTALALLMTTGVSLEELAALQWKNVSLGKLAYVTVGDYGKERVIPLEPEIADLLNELKTKNASINVDTLEMSVFRQSREDKPVSAPYMATMIRRATKKLIEKEVSPTELHEYCKQRMLKRYTLEVTMELLGKKKAVSVVRTDEQKVDLNRLRQIHTLAFQHL